MKILLNPSPEKWQKHLARPAMQTQKINQIVKPIFEKVEKSGDIRKSKEVRRQGLEEICERI